MIIKRYFTAGNVAISVLVLALFLYGDASLFNLVFFSLFLFVSFRVLQSKLRPRTRFLLILVYLTVMGLQIVFAANIIAGHSLWLAYPLRKVFAIASLAFPLIISRYAGVSKHSSFYLPTLQEAATISFAQLHELAYGINRAKDAIKKTGGSLAPDNIKTVIDDLPRHDSFHYVNDGSLTDDYFLAAEASLDDPNLYIIISNTGTAASEILSVFTRRKFNHASLSFDAALRTVVSYNGGARVYPPGLNSEMLDFFNKKPGSSILVYRLPVSCEQKKTALEKIAQINREGSAYNLLGLLIGQSYMPNIMYCSQFVYNMLDNIGAAYFEAAGTIKPTDLIEKDYYRKLVFVEELRINGLLGPHI